MLANLICQTTKSCEKAEALRKEGNDLYSKRKFKDSLLKYNASLCFSTCGSKNLGHAYANRSAVCFEIKKYEECIENIKLAKSHNYPEKNFETLNLREEKCKELMEKQKKSSMKWNFFKLSFEANKTNPQFVNFLELRNNEKYGRHIVTNKKISVGSILSIEEAFSKVLLSKSRHVNVDANNKYQRCTNCLKENILGLMPCVGCNCAMFCKECMSEAFKLYHKYECSVMEELLNSGSVHVALRIFFMGISAFNGSIEKFEKFMNTIDKKDDNFSIFNFDSNKKDVKNYLRFLNTLSRSDTQFSTTAHEQILKNHPELCEIFENHQEFIRGFLLRQCQNNDHYFHGIYGQIVADNNDSISLKDLQQPIGTGWFPFHSLINHSCANNVMRIYVDGKVVLVANRFIPSGSQLFDCYKVNFTKDQRVERQARLLREFGFKCDCEACLEPKTYSTPPPMKDIKLAKIALKIEEEIFSERRSIKTYKECCKLINDNHERFPSLELIVLQKSFAHFLLIQAK